MKLTLKHAIVVFGILPILAACGGGGGGAPVDDTAAMELAAKQAAQRTAISDAVSAASTAVNAVGNTSSDAVVTEAEDAITAAKAAVSAGAELPDGDNAIAAANATIAALETQLSTAKAARQTAMDAADRAAQEEADRLAAEARMVANAAAKKLYNAMTDTPAALASSIAAARYDADKNVKGKFGSYNTAEFMDTNADGKTTHVMQYDNKMPSKPTPLTEDVTTFVNTSIMATEFSSGEPKEHMRDSKGRFSTRGTYNGAAGEYICVATGATDNCVSRAADGGGIELGGTNATWTFDPDPGAMQQTPDNNYATFGWWLDESIADGTSKISTFSIRSVPDETIALGTVTGSATYKGIAVGKAVVYSPVGDNNIGGAFTADAALIATFGTSPMIEGSITDFDVGGKSPDWSVALNKTPLSATGVTEPSGTPENTTAWTIGGVKASNTGTWSGRLYDQGDAVGTFGVPPTGVTGGFNAVYGKVGRMVGAFGAEKE